MAEYPGALTIDFNVERVEIPGRAVAAYYLPALPFPEAFVDDPMVLAAPITGIGSDVHSDDAETTVSFAGSLGNASTPGLDFYERFHVVPRSIDAGNILSTTLISLEVFSAFRSLSQFWTAFDNNAGDGVTLLGAPTLPILVLPMAGFLLTVQITLDGPAVVDATLDFSFSGVADISVPITFQRVILLSFPPEQPYDEELEWLTDILGHVDDTEQRVGVRKNPRQFFSWDFLLEDGVERSRFENVLFDWQSRQFGIPIWHEATPLNAAVVGGSTTTITVVSTADADYRDGGLVMIYESQTKYDVLNLVSHTSTTLVVENPPGNSYTPLADLVLVAPLRLGIATAPRGTRYRTGVDRFRARFRVKDNDANLADASAYATFNSKILLDDPNFVEQTMGESYDQPLVVFDGKSGLTEEWSRPDRHRRTSQKGFVGNGKASLWQRRKLLYSLDGRRVSFYLPTFSSDLVPTGTMTSGASTLAVSNVGYTNFVRARQPKNVIRVVPVSGAAFLRTILSSTAPSSTTENITISGTWPSTLTPAQILRIEFVEKVRLASDTVRIQHRRGGAWRIATPVVTVLE